MLNWDDLNFFRSIAPERSFRRAAAKHNLSVNTIRSRIDRLEKALGMTLFQRSRDGLSLTIEGMTALDVVLEMDSAIGRLAPRANNAQSTGGEILSLYCTEGIGEFLLAPKLPALMESIASKISLQCDADQDRIHSTDRDICIGFARPTNPETIVCKLATIRFIPCASEAYLDRFGRPSSMEDLEGHRFILQESYGLTEESMRQIFGNERADRLIAAKTNGINLLHRAIGAGFGIGALPSHLCDLDTNIEILDLPIVQNSDLWMSFNRMSMSSHSKRNAIDWIKQCFQQMAAPASASDKLAGIKIVESGIHNQNAVSEAMKKMLVPAAGDYPTVLETPDFRYLSHPTGD